MGNEYYLSKGAHPTPADGRCAMEWVAYLAGEKHTDSPRCVDPHLAGMFIALNDRMDDDDRQSLRPYLARCIGTANDGMGPDREHIMRNIGRSGKGERCACGTCVAASLLDMPRQEMFTALDSLLPTIPIEMPVAADWQAVCQIGT